MSQRRTKQRAAVESVLQRASGFLTAQEIHERLEIPVALATVYRTVGIMLETDEVDAIRTADGQWAYRCCHHEGHHHHLICRACGHTVEVHFDNLEEVLVSMAKTHGFTDLEHEIELAGLCAQCSASAQG